MPDNPVEHLYKTYLSDMHLERRGLFEALADAFPSETVLYPGCQIHVTPSFFFPHVVYVDNGVMAADFFKDTDAVQALVDRNKKYGRSAHVRFIGLDFTQDLSLRDNSFDLLISLYAGGIAASCHRYLRPGGLILTNNHHDDAGEAARSPVFGLAAVIHERGKQVRISGDDLEDYFIPRTNPSRKERTGRPEYTKNADYYVFRKRGRDISGRAGGIHAYN
ncbi:class I SAM-dependent methyltransferase [bacterium]|nr:class I SAM-dependent methyltransferase [bacterium]